MKNLDKLWVNDPVAKKYWGDQKGAKSRKRRTPNFIREKLDKVYAEDAYKRHKANNNGAALNVQANPLK